MAASATLALKAGVWFRRGRLLIVSPDSLGTACPLSGRNSTYRPVQILEASSVLGQGSLTITYDGLRFVISNVSGDVAINNMPMSNGDVLPGSCVIVLGPVNQ